MSVKIGTSDVLWGYVVQILQFGSSILVLPIALRLLSGSQMGLWYAFTSVVALASLLDFGFQATISVNVSYVYSGAKRLLKEGCDKDEISAGANYELLKKLIGSIKVVYFAMAVLALLLLGTVGTLYITKIANYQVDWKMDLVAWIALVIATAINLYSGLYQALLQGRGSLKHQRIATVVSRALFVLISVILLIYGFGLLSLAIGTACQAASGYFLSRRFFFDSETVDHLAKVTSNADFELLPILFFNAKKTGVVLLGSFLINRGNILVCAYYLTPDTTAKFGLTMQMFNFLVQFSMNAFSTFIPKMNSHRIKSEDSALKNTIGLGLLAAFSSFVLGGVLLIFVGPIVLHKIGSHTSLAPTSAMAFIFLTLLLEMNHSAAASVIATRNIIPYVKPAVISGCCILFFSIILVQYTELGIWSMLIPQFFVQLCYNNWKWPREMVRDLKCGYKELLFKGGALAAKKATPIWSKLQATWTGQ